MFALGASALELHTGLPLPAEGPAFEALRNSLSAVNLPDISTASDSTQGSLLPKMMRPDTQTASLSPFTDDVARLQRCVCCVDATPALGTSPMACELCVVSRQIVASAARRSGHSFDVESTKALSQAVARALTPGLTLICRSLITSLMSRTILERFVLICCYS